MVKKIYKYIFIKTFYKTIQFIQDTGYITWNLNFTKKKQDQESTSVNYKIKLIINLKKK